MQPYDSFFRHPFMSDEGLRALSAQALVEAMLAFELALAAEQESLDLLPVGTATALERHLAITVFDVAAIARDAAKGGNPAIPFVKQAKALLPGDLKGRFHCGVTSQDVVDSALMQVLGPRLRACLAGHEACRRAGLTLMADHRDTPMIGRTLMQQALPITFGLKVARWTWGLEQAAVILRTVSEQGLYLQLGGPVGTLAGMRDKGLTVMAGVARRLGLSEPLLPWHTDRQPVLAIGAALSAMAVAADKIALDIVLMAQNEIAELSEPAEEGVGGSSSMPHKRNPVACARIRAAARQVQGAVTVLNGAGVQPLERGLGEWHAEWAPLLDAVLLLEGALESLAALLTGLEVHVDAMRRNLDLSGANAEPDVGASGGQVDRVRERLMVS